MFTWAFCASGRLRDVEGNYKNDPAKRLFVTLRRPELILPMHSERIFKVQIPDELKDNYKSGLPAFREPKLEAGENQHNHRVQGETVAGTLHESGLFVYTLSSGYIPVFLENVQVLVELEKFLVDSPTRSESRGLHYKKEPDGDKVPNKVVKWGSFVYGMVVAENTNWVQVGEYYLPIEWNGHQVLYPAESWNAAPKSFAPDQTARLCLFAPHEGDYFVTGTFTKSWKTAWDLTPEPFSESRAKGFRGRIYYVDVPVQELNNAEFKFRFHEKGTWKQVTDFLYITEKLKWEYDSLNNRTVKLDGRVAPGSKLFMYWGFPEASEQHVMEFLKVVLSGPGLNGLDEAMRRVDEVRQSVRQVTCKWPTARRTSVEQFDRLIPLALRDVLDSRPPAGPQPCSGVFVWMAVLEQRTRGNLSMLHHIRPEVVSVVAKWPPDIMSDARLAGCVHAAAKSALREEARNTSRKLSGQWLQAAIQVILHSETSIAEIPGAELVERGVVPQWAEIRLKDAPQARIESALRIAFKPAHTLQEVFDAAKAFLDHADRRAWGPLCVQTALEEGLAWVERSMDWGAGANNLQRLLDCLDDARVDEKNLVDIIQKAWRRLGARPHIIPEPTGHLNQSTRIVSQALTAEPEDADFVEFEGSSAFSWLRLAVLASNYSVLLSAVTRHVDLKCFVMPCLDQSALTSNYAPFLLSASRFRGCWPLPN
ncbi:unnamed protein product [Durusdinium trenchii]|uniref:Uncharacterized protein n=3 Tax=Durusdinium trenchii TaxID=1381693 RepID=A0ABP0KBL2_9DINO